MAIDFIVNTLPQIIGTTGSILSITDYFARHHPAHTKKHLARNLELMSEYMREKQHENKDPGDTWRNDWFSENQVSNPRVLRRLLDKTVKEIINDSEERKSKHIAKFWVNICLTSNADIDESTAFSYLETIESLSWRQLCIIRIIALNDNGKIDRHSKISDEIVEKLSDDQRMTFHAIGREYQELMDNHYIDGTAMPHVSSQDKWNGEPWLDAPEFWGMPNYTKRLHDLMDLNEISDREITDTFSVWGVKLKKS